MFRKAGVFVAVFGLAAAVSLLAVDAADARRGGSFGSRGARTYSAPPPTRTAPEGAAPVQRSMTSPAPGQSAGQRPAAPTQQAGAQAQRRGGFLGGLGGGILGGLLVGGLIGALLGHGFGTGMGATLAVIVQVAAIGLGVWLLMKLFRRRQPAPAVAGWPSVHRQAQPEFGQAGGLGQSYTPVTPPPATEDIIVTSQDREAFEQLLCEVQEAFSREDYGALRERTTPEVMSYLAEELSENATQGRRNEVSRTRLLEADVAEAWREGGREYATAAMRYESVDVMRDRQSGAVLGGDTDRPTQAIEHWTFVREPGSRWMLSAIQGAG